MDERQMREAFQLLVNTTQAQLQKMEERVVTLENKVATLNEFMILQNEGNEKVTYALDMLNEMVKALHERFPSENSSEAP
jgi:uncharacterized coiled-coil protein SlyX